MIKHPRPYILFATMDTTTHLQLVFQYYCRFGRTGGHYDATMDSFQFGKLTRDCPGLLDDLITPTEVDLVFIKVKAKTARRITFSQFLDALSALATVKYYGVVEDAATAFSLLLTNQVFQTSASLGIVSAVMEGQLQVGGDSSGRPTGVKLSASAAGQSAFGGTDASRPVSPHSRGSNAAAAAGSTRRGASPRRYGSSGNGGAGEWETPLSPSGAGAMPTAGPPLSPRSPSGIAAAMLRGAGYLDHHSNNHGGAGGPGGALDRSVSSFQMNGDAAEPSNGGLPTNDMSSPVLSFVTPPVDVYELMLRKAYEAQLLGQQQQQGQQSASSSSASGWGGVDGSPRSDRGAGGNYRGLGGSAAASSTGSSKQQRGRATTTTPHPSVTLGATLSSGQSPRPMSPRAGVERGPGMARYGEPDFVPTIAGSANRPGSVYERLANPASFTGVYRRAWQSDGRINHFTETGLSLLPSRFRGNTNTGSDETIRDIRVLLRPNLNVGRYFK